MTWILYLFLIKKYVDIYIYIYINVFSGQHFSSNVYISIRSISGDVTSKWTSSTNSSMYNVSISKDMIPDPWKRVYNTQYTVRDALLYDNISIIVRLLEYNIDNILEFKGKARDKQ